MGRFLVSCVVVATWSVRLSWALGGGMLEFGDRRSGLVAMNSSWLMESMRRGSTFVSRHGQRSEAAELDASVSALRSVLVAPFRGEGLAPKAVRVNGDGGITAPSGPADEVLKWLLGAGAAESPVESVRLSAVLRLEHLLGVTATETAATSGHPQRAQEMARPIRKSLTLHSGE